MSTETDAAGMSDAELLDKVRQPAQVVLSAVDNIRERLKQMGVTDETIVDSVASIERNIPRLDEELKTALREAVRRLQGEGDEDFAALDRLIMEVTDDANWTEELMKRIRSEFHVSRTPRRLARPEAEVREREREKDALTPEQTAVWMESIAKCMKHPGDAIPVAALEAGARHILAQHTQIEALTKEKADLYRSTEQANADAIEAETKQRAAERRNAALVKYTRHDDDCPALRAHIIGKGKCRCGLAALLDSEKEGAVPDPQRSWMSDDRCHADSDGHCVWTKCPQLRDNEPHKSGRHCPLDSGKEG